VPSAEQILSSLSAIANGAGAVAIAWHVAIAGLGLLVARGWRPSCKALTGLLTLPLASVAVAAWASANPFNGAVFSILALALGVLAARMAPLALPRPPSSVRVLGALVACFGLVYPHFVETEHALQYLYRAPTGLVPCPTLALVIGVALMADGLGSRALGFLLGVAGVFYALFGALQLGVVLDVGLLLGALLLLARAALRRHPVIARSLPHAS